MKHLLRVVPPYKWLLVLPQLTSRVCHAQPDVQGLMQVGDWVHPTLQLLLFHHTVEGSEGLCMWNLRCKHAELPASV
jgi:hypothetical protein